MQNILRNSHRACHVCQRLRGNVPKRARWKCGFFLTPNLLRGSPGRLRTPCHCTRCEENGSKSHSSLWMPRRKSPLFKLSVLIQFQVAADTMGSWEKSLRLFTSLGEAGTQSVRLIAGGGSCPRGPRIIRHSPAVCGQGCHRSSKASGSEDLQIEESIGYRYAPAFHFHVTLASMQRSTLLRHQVLQMR